MTTKKAQRIKLRKDIKAYKGTETASQRIQDKLFQTKEYKESKSIFIYLSLENEVDTKNIIIDAFSNGKRVFVPITKDNGIMFMSEIEVSTEYKKGKFDIAQPLNFNINEENVDLVIVPLVGFDKEKNRLGQGGGYYDRFLSKNNSAKIALAFAFQELDKIIVADNDIKMDKIITEDKIF